MNTIEFISHLKSQVEVLKRNKKNIEQLREKILELDNNYKYIRKEKSENEYLFQDRLKKNEKTLVLKSKEIQNLKKNLLEKRKDVEKLDK